MNPNAPINHQLGLSLKVSKLWREGSDLGELRRHAASLYAQFEESSAIEKLNQAIECWKSVVSRVPDSDGGRRALNNLGIAYCSRFDQLGDPGDLEVATEYGLQAVSHTPDSHPDKPAFLDSLGVSHRTRFKLLGKMEDLNRAIELGTRAVSLAPDDHEDRRSALNNLGISYQDRFERLGEVADLNEAIECGTQAVLIAPNTVKPKILNNLGVSYRTRFERLGESVDLSKAIECGLQAVFLTPDGHAEKPSRLSNLGISHRTRFSRLGEVADLNKAIECGAQAVLLTPDGHADRSTYHDGLGNSYQTRFERLGDLADLDKAIEHGLQAISLATNGRAVKLNRPSNLGNSYRIRFGRLGELADLNKAIVYGVQAISLTPDDHADKPGHLNNLGISYQTRFHHLGELEDLNRAIECGVQSVSLTPDGHAVKPSRLSNLGNSYLSRFDRLREVEDPKVEGLKVEALNMAIEYGAQAVSLTPSGHTDKPRYLNNLGNSYRARFVQHGEVDDLKRAIEHGEQAVSLIPDGHSDKPGHLNNLGISHRAGFERLGDVSNLNKAIEYGEEVVSLTPDGHASKPMYLGNLAASYRLRFSQSNQPSDLELAISFYRAAAQSLVGSSFTKLQACLSWARLASLHPMPSQHPTSSPYPISSPYPAYLRAIDLLPQVVWIGNTLGQRYVAIANLGDFATEAAAYAIGIDKHELALEWLEAGRSIVWGQAAQLRTPFELLSSRDSDLAKRLKDIGFQLEHAESRASVIPSSQGNDIDLKIEASNHIQLALEWDMLLKQARSLPGFEDFLQPPKSRVLLGAAKSHPIAIINIHKSRSDALILRPDSDSISHVPLKELSIKSVADMCKLLVSQGRQRKMGHLRSVEPLEKSLSDLWFSVLQPILDFLGYTSDLSIEELPRLTWCTTGPLSFLPLHAAGCYDGVQPNAMKRVISSYTPTLSALLAQRPDTLNMHRGILAVGQEHTPGMNSLPFVKDELAIVEKHAHNHRYPQLKNEEATVERVLETIDQFSWVHIACHGDQDTANPTHSAFHLHDGRLTLAEIAKKSFANKGLAFLSACQTATGEKNLPEEAVHLAAGMLMAGFPSVIGTMWSIADEDGPKIADKVYASLLKNGKMDRTEAARALHGAVVELCATVGENSFERWAPFIYIGR